jgi:hypothetical protein
MKIFDFTCAQRGRHIGDAPLAAAMGGWLVRKGDKVFKVTLATNPGKPDEEWSWSTGAAFNERGEDGQCTGALIDIDPADYGAEAICFCTGNWRTGPGEGKWVWTVIGTPEWNRKACLAGVLESTFSHMAPAQAAE